MLALKRFGRSLFDVRPGEYAITAFMSLYLMLVLFAYYILKPVSRSMFLNNLDLDKLPWLYILIAGIGGGLAYLYTRVAMKSSLARAVNFATAFCVAVLVLLWWLLQYQAAWILYAFNIWVSLFSVILVSQGWLVAANLFTSREAKRLYGVIGAGSVLGAAFGGQFTAIMVYRLAARDLLLASAGMVILSYIAYRMALATSGRSLGAARAAEEEEFRFAEIVGAIARVRHLQVIVAVMTITFIVDVMVEYQFSAFAQRAYHGRELTAFLGNFYGFWLNLITIVLQLFLTGFVVSRFGVGGTLQIMPVAIAAASTASLVAPSLLSTAAARLTEASTRYSFNKTGMELLYLPLPLELRNRVKAFVDVFIDRLARGLGGIILLLLPIAPRRLSIVVLVLAAAWIVLSVVAQRQYMATVRQRFEKRRLDLEAARVPVSDRATVELLERTARSERPRQAAYALELLSCAPGHRTDSLLSELVKSPHAEVRAKVFEVARKTGNPALSEAAFAELRNARGGSAGAVREAILYAMSADAEPLSLARRLLDHPNADAPPSVLDALAARPELARELIGHDWLRATASDADPRRRALAAQAIGIRGDAGTEALFALLNDPDPGVATQAIRTAGALKSREYFRHVVNALGSPRLRGAAIEALAALGPKIRGSLGDLLLDEAETVRIRRYVPRVLLKMGDQGSVDILVRGLSATNLTVRAAILKALNRLRENKPSLDFGAPALLEQVREEARYYLDLHANLAPLRERESNGPATSLVIRTLEDRLRSTLDRLFRLLGLRYPPRQIYAAYQAIDRRAGDDCAAALDFLDHVLDRELKRVLLPLFDEDAMLAKHAREVFHIERKDVSGALRSLIQSQDPWLAACGIAAAGELRIHELSPDIRDAGQGRGREIAEVARAAVAVLD